MNYLQIIAVIASLLVAVGTGALAAATFRMIWKNDKWNQRTERIKVLPFISFTFEGLSGKKYYFKMCNLGWGPALSILVIISDGERTLHPTPDTPYPLMLKPGETSIIKFIEPKVGEANINIECRDVFDKTIVISYTWVRFPESPEPSVELVDFDASLP